MNKYITIGSDPELFIWNKELDEPVSSIGLIPGVKGEAYLPDGFEEGFGLQIDNVLAEFNIPPVKTKEDFINNINLMKKYIDEYVSSKDENFTIKCSSSEIFPSHQLDSDEARLFGCSVDYNVYLEGPNPKPNGEATNMRSAGMHIHVGYKNPQISESVLLIKYLDMYVGIPSMFIDNDLRRRELYGKAGCFRLCPYGVEWRTLSGLFIRDDKTLEFVWDQTVRAIEEWESKTPLLNSQSVERIINNYDIEEAKKACDMFNIIKLT